MKSCERCGERAEYLNGCAHCAAFVCDGCFCIGDVCEGCVEFAGSGDEEER